MQISALGDSALLIDFSDESGSREVLLHRALTAAHLIESRKIPGIIEITSAFQSLAVFFDAARFVSSALAEEISPLIQTPAEGVRSQSRLVDIPMCCDNEFALDSARLAHETNLSFEKLIEIFCRTEFSVACIGFMPGFPYLADLPRELHLPRLATPRTKVPAGSVAIANAQAGIYPFESPGGWNIIGRTPLCMFHPEHVPPALLRPGDRVRFQRISRLEFEVANKN